MCNTLTIRVTWVYQRRNVRLNPVGTRVTSSNLAMLQYKKSDMPPPHWSDEVWSIWASLLLTCFENLSEDTLTD